MFLKFVIVTWLLMGLGFYLIWFRKYLQHEGWSLKMTWMFPVGLVVGPFALLDSSASGVDQWFANNPVTKFLVAPDEQGYWLQTANGNLLPFGSATRLGLEQALGSALGNAREHFYTAAGTVFTTGKAQKFGEVTDRRLDIPLLMGQLTSSKQGYWLVYADGAVRAFGDAVDFGSTEAHPEWYGITWKPLAQVPDGKQLIPFATLQTSSVKAETAPKKAPAKKVVSRKAAVA